MNLDMIEDTGYKNNPSNGRPAKLYRFKNKHNPTSISKFASSATKNKFDDLWPWLYAKIHNKESLKENRNNKYIWLDFVNIQ